MGINNRDNCRYFITSWRIKCTTNRKFFALPFSIVVVLMVTSLFKELRKEDVNLQTKEVPKNKKVM